MDKEIIENMNKIPFFYTKLNRVDSLLKEKNYVEAYKAVASLIEMTCILVLEKMHKEKVEDSNIVVLASIFDRHHKEEIKECLININGEYNYIDLNKVDEIDVMVLLGNLDDLVKIMIKKYGNLF